MIDTSIVSSASDFLGGVVEGFTDVFRAVFGALGNLIGSFAPETPEVPENPGETPVGA